MTVWDKYTEKTVVTWNQDNLITEKQKIMLFCSSDKLPDFTECRKYLDKSLK